MSENAAQQPRKARGVPSAGEWESNPQRDQATSSLSTGLDPNRSFSFPPHLSDSDEVVAYFEDIRIDDATVSKFVDAYGSARAKWAEWELEKYETVLEQRHGSDWTKRQADQDLKFRELEREHPTYVNPVFARDVTRALQMARIAEWSLDSDEEEKLLKHEMTMSNGAKASVGFLKKRYMGGKYEADLV